MPADLGADVLKVEAPRDDTRSFGPPFVDGSAAYRPSIGEEIDSTRFKRSRRSKHVHPVGQIGCGGGKFFVRGDGKAGLKRSFAPGKSSPDLCFITGSHDLIVRDMI